MSGQIDKQEMNDYVRNILRPRRETTAAEDEALVAQSLARGATSAAATELRNRLESARRGETIAREARELFLRLLHFRTLLPGAAQDGDQLALVLALFRQFRIAEEEYQVRFCGPDDEALMYPGRLDRFPPEVALDADLACSRSDAGDSPEGEGQKEEEQEQEEEGPRVKMEVKDDDLSVKVVRFGDVREVKVEVDESRLEAVLNAATRSLRLRSEEPGSRHDQPASYEPDSRPASPAAEAEYDALARAPWESEDEDEVSGNVKQEEVEPDLGTMSQEQDRKAGILDSVDVFADDEPEVKQEEDLRADGYDSDEWLYGNSSAVYPYMDDCDGNAGSQHEDADDADDEQEDTYPDQTTMNSDDWLYGPGYGASDSDEQESTSDVGEGREEHGKVADNESFSTDGDDAGSVGTVRSYRRARARSMTLSDVDTMHVEREASVDLDCAMGSGPTGLDVSEAETPSTLVLPPWSPQCTADMPHIEVPYGPSGLFYHRPDPIYPPLVLRTPSPTIALPPFGAAAHAPSPPRALHPSTYAARTFSPPPALHTSAAVAADDIPPLATLATLLEREQVPAQHVAPSTSGVQRRQATRGRGAHAAPYVRPTAHARQAWARSRIHDPSPMDTTVAPYDVHVSLSPRGEIEQEIDQAQFNNIHDDL